MFRLSVKGEAGNPKSHDLEVSVVKRDSPFFGEQVAIQVNGKTIIRLDADGDVLVAKNEHKDAKVIGKLDNSKSEPFVKFKD